MSFNHITDPVFTFSEVEHSMCELHDWKVEAVVNPYADADNGVYGPEYQGQ